MEKKPVQLMETVLRDGHQSILATRMHTRHMLPMLEALDAIGYAALECWGGATFDSMIRFLDENPWIVCAPLKLMLKRRPYKCYLEAKIYLAISIMPMMLYMTLYSKLLNAGLIAFGFSMH